MMGHRRRGRPGFALGPGLRRSQSRITTSTQRATMITWRLDPSTGEVLIMNYQCSYTDPIACSLANLWC